jgi:hypothetical protein
MLRAQSISHDGNLPNTSRQGEAERNELPSPVRPKARSSSDQSHVSAAKRPGGKPGLEKS